MVLIGIDPYPNDPSTGAKWAPNITRTGPRRTVALVAQLGVGASAEQGGGAEAEALRKRWSFVSVIAQKVINITHFY